MVTLLFATYAISLFSRSVMRAIWRKAYRRSGSYRPSAASFHRIRHYGLLAKAPRATDLGWLRTLISAQAGEPAAPIETTPEPAPPDPPICPSCGGHLRVVEVFRRGYAPRTVGRLWMDSS